MLRHPDVYAGVKAELEELYADGGAVSFHALRQIPRLENVLKETLRLHPPLIILMRVAKDDFEVRLPDPQRRHGRGVAGDLQPDRRGLPRPGQLRAGPLREAASRRS